MKLSWLVMTLYIVILFGFLAFSMQSCVTVEVNSGTDNSQEEKETSIGIGYFEDEGEE